MIEYRYGSLHEAEETVEVEAVEEEVEVRNEKKMVKIAPEEKLHIKFDPTLPRLHREIPDAPYAGNFGSIFISEDKKVKSNLSKISRNILHQEMRETVREPMDDLSAQAHHFGLMINKGADSPEVTKHLINSHRLQRINHERLKNLSKLRMLYDDNHSYKHLPLPINASSSGMISAISSSSAVDKCTAKTAPTAAGNNLLLHQKRDLKRIRSKNSITSALLQQEKNIEGGKYCVGNIVQDEFRTPISSHYLDSNHALSTPKMWSSDTMYTKNHHQEDLFREKKAVACSKSRQLASNNADHDSSKSVKYSSSYLFSHTDPSSILDNQTVQESNAMSSLQQTLVGCGSLKLIQSRENNLVAEHTNEIINKHKKLLNMHSNWLQNKQRSILTADSSDKNNRGDDASISTKGSVSKSSSHVDTKGVMKHGSHELTFRYLLGDSKYADDAYNEEMRHKSMNTESYEQAMIDHLQLYTSDSMYNPFRRSLDRYDKPSMNVQNVSKDNPILYRQPVMVKQAGRYSVISRTPAGVGQVPTKEDINKSLATLCRKSTLCYDVRIVETGATLGALQNVLHPTPGLAAIIDMHRSFVDSACLNPDPWLLSRPQLTHVIKDKLTWLNEEIIKRLVSAYDPQRGGLIRYIRLSVSLLCCARPAMTQLITILNAANEKKKEIQRQSAKLRGVVLDEDEHEDDVLKSKELLEYQGEIFLLRLIHGLYEDCDGRMNVAMVDENGQALPADSIPVIGIKITDIVESLSCCATGIEDELAMEKACEPLLQLIYKEAMENDLVYKDIFKQPTKAANLDMDYAMRLPSGNDSVVSISSSSINTNDNMSTTSLVMGGDSIAWLDDKSLITKKSLTKRQARKLATKRMMQGLPYNDDFSTATSSTKTSSHGHFKKKMIKWNKLLLGVDGNTADIDGSNGSLSAARIIKHKHLMDVKHIPRVTQEQYVRCIVTCGGAFKEFIRQLKIFRELIEPYSIKGTVTFVESKEKELSFGARNAGIKPAYI